jgi:hypothetical protein
MGALGPTLIFVCLMVGEVIVATCVLAYVAHCLLVIVQDTAAGIDRVRWPDEPFMDWLLRAVFLGILLSVWLVPAGILSRSLRHVWLPDDPGLRFLILAVPGLWLFLPVGLLSSLGSVSRWGFLRPSVIAGLLRQLPRTVAFYAISLALAVGAAFLWREALRSPRLLLLPVAAIASAYAFLVYARLLGRLAWLINRQMTTPRPAARAIKPPKEAAHVRSHDPWSAPASRPKATKTDEPPSPPLPVSGYGLADEEPPKRPPIKPLDGYDPIGDDLPPEDEEEPASPLRGRSIRRPLERARPEPIPAFPLFNGVYSFPCYDTSLKAWVLLSFGGMVLGVGLKGMLAFFPGG